jgi:hypothetical protein
MMCLYYVLYYYLLRLIERLGKNASPDKDLSLMCDNDGNIIIVIIEDDRYGATRGCLLSFLSD